MARRSVKTGQLDARYTVKKMGMDTNGNHSVWVSFRDGRAKKIQTLYNLPITHKVRELTPEVAGEILDYVDSRNINPAPRIGTKRPRRVSQVTKKPPTRRLIARRKANSEPGYYPNPTGRLFTHYVSQVKHGASMRVGEMVCLTLDATTAAEIANVLNLHRDPSVVFKSHKLARPVQE